MKPPIFIRPLTEDEQSQVQTGLRSSDAFVLRRGPILLASARGERAPAIAHHLGCDDQTVRNVIHDFNTEGLAVLQEGSSRPHRLRTTFTPDKAERLRDLLHRSPRDFGKERGLWTLELAAQVRVEQGILSTLVSDESVRRALKRLGTTWKRAKHADHQPRSAVPGKKNARDRLIAWASQHPTWAIGFGGRASGGAVLPCLRRMPGKVRTSPCGWWSKLGAKRTRIGSALACYGVLWQQGTPQDPDRSQMWLRFVTGRPVSAITSQFLEWCCEQLSKQDKTRLSPDLGQCVLAQEPSRAQLDPHP